MKETKFRVWDETRGKFWYFSLNDSIAAIRRVLTLSEWNDLEKEQYTGLKDKNGKEIWKGDIVQYGNKKALVYWDKYMWNVVDYYNQLADSPGDAFSEGVFEVIGNVHENPELLN